MVIVLIDYKAVYIADPNNKEIVTSIETLNYSHKKIPTIIIFKGAYYLRKHFQNDIDSNTLFTCSSTRFTNNKLSLVYLKHFNKFYPLSIKGKY